MTSTPTDELAGYSQKLLWRYNETWLRSFVNCHPSQAQKLRLISAVVQYVLCVCQYKDGVRRLKSGQNIPKRLRSQPLCYWITGGRTDPFQCPDCVWIGAAPPPSFSVCIGMSWDYSAFPGECTISETTYWLVYAWWNSCVSFVVFLSRRKQGFYTTGVKLGETEKRP